MLFAHVPGPETISFDVARGRAAHLRRRLDELHKETVLGLKQESRPGTSRPAVRSASPPRPGTSTSQALTAAHWSASPCQPGVSLSSALTADQLAQIKSYLQGQQLLPENEPARKHRHLSDQQPSHFRGSFSLSLYSPHIGTPSGTISKASPAKSCG